jgi:O-antigen/teichoic acid export membrane protein
VISHQRHVPLALRALASRDDQLSATQRLPLPEGTLPVGVGLLIAGISSYAFFKIGVKALGAEGFKPISSLWFATFFLAPGFFLPLEQELGRALAHRRGLRQGGRPVVRRVVPLAVLLTAVVGLVIVIFSGAITTKFFEGDWVVTAALLVGFMSYAPAHLARGICSGQGRFTSYGVVMGADGASRIVGCLILWTVGVTTTGAYAFVVALAPLVGVLAVTLRHDLRTEPGPPSEWAEVTQNLGWLLLGSVFAAGLVNAGPIAVDLLQGDAPNDYVTQFGYAVLLGRVPLFLFQAVQAALLPRLARLAVLGALAEFRLGFRKLLIVVIAVGGLGVIGAAILGPYILNRVYDASLGHRDLTLLVLGTAIYMVALTFAQAVIALHGHALVAIGWASGMAAFVLFTWLSSDDLYLRVEIGLVASSVVAACFFALSLRHRLAVGVGPDESSLFEAATDGLVID